ncbi:hypothetical protein JST97_19800 [bacterium]|nr:hypothetical protein [bacterium]
MLWFLLGFATTGLFRQMPLSSDYLLSDLPYWSGTLLALVVAIGVLTRGLEAYQWILLPALIGLFLTWNAYLAQLSWIPLIYAFWLSSTNLALREVRSPMLVLGQLQIILAPCWLLRTQTGISTPTLQLATLLGAGLWTGTGWLIERRRAADPLNAEGANEAHQALSRAPKIFWQSK